MKNSSKIFLLGYMASGKSTIGRMLARKLGYEFWDLDEMIVEAAGKSIPAIFESEGETAFRELEAEVLRSTNSLSEVEVVIATGGGTPCFEGNLEWILENGRSIYLEFSPAMLLGRLRQQKAQRPVIADLEEDELTEFIQDHLSERMLYYEQADISVLYEGESKGQLCEKILAFL